MSVDRSIPPPASGCSLAELLRPPVESRDAAGLRDHIELLLHDLGALQRLATLGSMAAMIAHEFNNLMTPVLARAEAALAEDDPAAMRKALERTVTQVQRAIVVAQRVLGLAHDGREGAGACAVHDALHEAIETAIRPFEKDGIELRIDVPPSLLVRANFDLLSQVLLNLLLNARQAMHGGRGVLTVSAAAQDGVVVIDVCDRGPGIPAERLEQRFNPFFAARVPIDPCDWHTIGLGLNVCRTIAQQFGATIEARANSDGPGCTFRLRWPAAARPS